MTACVIAFVLLVVTVTGCGKDMMWQLVDPMALPSDAADRQWNTYRFHTVGPFVDQQVAYVLFGDNSTVEMWQFPYVNLGKMSIREVLQDHDAYLKSKQWTGTALIFHEYHREGKLIAYTANETEMEVDLWEMAASATKVDLRMVYIDRRSSSGPPGGDSGQSGQSSH